MSCAPRPLHTCQTRKNKMNPIFRLAFRREVGKKSCWSHLLLYVNILNLYTIPESRKLLLAESRILCFGIRNPAQGIHIISPTIEIQNPVPRMWNPNLHIDSCLGQNEVCMKKPILEWEQVNLVWAKGRCGYLGGVVCYKTLGTVQ